MKNICPIFSERQVICLSANTAMTELFCNGKMRICVLKGSPNGDGATQRMLDEFLRRFPYASADIFDAYSIKAKPCTDCKFCSSAFGCASKDLDDFFKAYESCDIFVTAFPIYFLSLPSPMKSILDRFQKYFSARFSFPILKIKRLLIQWCPSLIMTVFGIYSLWIRIMIFSMILFYIKYIYYPWIFIIFYLELFFSQNILFFRLFQLKFWICSPKKLIQILE